MMAEVRLISTDFDGTLIGHPSDGRCGPELAETLCAFKESGGLWALNTGRSLNHAIEGASLFSAGVMPDFFLTNEREVFRQDRGGEWIDYGGWNSRCRERHERLFRKSEGIFDGIRAQVSDSPDVTIIEEEGHPVGLVTTDESIMEEVVRGLAVVQADFPEFNYQRNTIYLRFCHRDYHKGAALGELMRLLEIGPDAVFAVGDHFNDIPMLEGNFARWVACPVNAIPEVKAVVRARGGYVAARQWGDGAAEAMQVFGIGRVLS